MSDLPHIPVLLEEVKQYLFENDTDAPGLYVDGTFGNGGYSRAILSAGHEVIAIDRDPSAISNGATMVEEFGERLRLVEGRFSALDVHLNSLGITSVDGVVLDIGVSSMQLDQAQRGFSFRADGPLDMRMEMSGLSAADVVNTFSKADLKRIISVLGEEKKAGYVAHAIVEARERAPITTTEALAEITEHAVGRNRRDKIHPATRTFQALRIFVNRELDELCKALFASEKILAPGGRLVVVSFHSLEDRIVKKFMKERSKTGGGGSRHMPVVEVAQPSFKEITKQAISAGETEASSNPRARSAKLRAAARLDAPVHGNDMAAIGLPNLNLSQRGAR